jgi:hypothetical protein
VAKATLANLRAHRSSEVHLSTAASRSKRCSFRLDMPCNYCKCCKVLEGLEDMPAKRSVALEAISPIPLVATLFCSIQKTWEAFDSIL